MHFTLIVMIDELPPTGWRFTQRFSSRHRSVRLARYLTRHQLNTWGFAYGSPLSDTASLVVTELSTNAVTHGHVPGRDFEVVLEYPGFVDVLRVEVTDARGETRPDPKKLTDPPSAEETGRGLLLVAGLAASWGVADRQVGKTVWAELPLTASPPPPGTW